MTDLPPRIPALAPAEFTAEQAALVGDWSHLNFSRVMAHHPAAYRAFVPLIDKLIRQTELPPRDREILVLRTLALSDETYEAHHHLLIARNAGMSDAEIQAARTGQGLAPFDQLLARAAEELLADQRVSDATWRGLAARYTPVQLMEVVLLVGGYATMAMATRSFGIQLEHGADTYDRISELRQYT